MNRRILAMVGLPAAALILAACNTGAASSPSTAQQSSAGLPSASQEMSSSEASASSSPSGNGGGMSNLNLHADSDLEAMLPDQIGDQSVETASLSGQDFRTLVGGSDQVKAFLRSENVPLDSVTVAFTTSTGDPRVLAFRVSGASADDLVSEFKAAVDSTGTSLSWESKEVGGKQVEVGPQPDSDPPVATYLYAKDDVLFLITGADETAADQILSALP